MNIEQVLKQFGYSLRPISEAPRDGRKILGISERKGLVICSWDVSASKFAGATWLEEKDAERGYIDRYFSGWLDPHSFEPLQQAALKRLIGAYLEDARVRRGEAMTPILSEARGG
jgi:hypothetical protein